VLKINGHITGNAHNRRDVMKKIAYLAVLASALISAPAFAGGGGGARGLAINASVLTGSNGVLGLLSGRSNGGLGINATVTTGKGGLLGAVLGRGGLLGGGGSHGGCGCI
jgi:hypothetical protein